MDNCPEPLLLGTAHDHELAGRWKVSVSSVRRWRRARGVKAHGQSDGPDAHGLVDELAHELGLGPELPPHEEDRDVAHLTRLEFLELKLRETRRAARRSKGVAKAQFYKLELELKKDLELAQATGGRRQTADVDLARLVLTDVVRAWAESVLAGKHGEVGTAELAVLPPADPS
jgi:hypothetical protein